jgi:hypothetical protein
MQTITKCNEIPQGKTYPVADLRTAKSIDQLCEYVDAGHPIATNYGSEARLFHKASKLIWRLEFYERKSWCLSCGFYEGELLDGIKLAPLAYRNGRPLHVGDEISTSFACAIGNLYKSNRKITIDNIEDLKSGEFGESWCFADEVAP